MGIKCSLDYKNIRCLVSSSVTKHQYLGMKLRRIPIGNGQSLSTQSVETAYTKTAVISLFARVVYQHLLKHFPDWTPHPLVVGKCRLLYLTERMYCET